MTEMSSATIAESDDNEKSFPRVTMPGRIKRLSYGLGRGLPLEDIGALESITGRNFKDSLAAAADFYP